VTDYVVNIADITVSYVCLPTFNFTLFSTCALSENCFRYLQLTFRATAWVHPNKYCTNFCRDLAIYFVQVIEKKSLLLFFFLFLFLALHLNYLQLHLGIYDQISGIRKNLVTNYVHQNIACEPHANCRRLDTFLILKYKEHEANLNDSWGVVSDVGCWIVTQIAERNKKLE